MLRDMFSFQNFNTSQLTREFTSVVSNVDIQSTGGRDNGPCLRIQGVGAGSGFNSSVEKTYDSQQTWIVGMRMKVTNLPTLSPWYFLKFQDSATVHVQIGIGTDGTLKAYRNTSLLGSSTNALTTDTLYYVEVKVKIDDSVGTVDIHVNGVSWLSLSGQDTRNAGNASANAIYWGQGTTAVSTYTYYCDVYIADTQAGQVTDFIGPQRCDARFFTADGNYTDWTPSTGANRYGVVDDNPANDDTDYATGAAGNKMTLKTLALGYTPATIYGVKLTGVMKKTASGTINVKRLARKSSTDYSSGNLAPPDTSYLHISEVLETDPATSAAFTKTDLESNIEWGFEVV